MSKVNAIIKDKKTLVLEQDAKKGDYISLDDLMKVDYSYLEKRINEGSDELYNKKLEDFKKLLEADYAYKIRALEDKIKQVQEASDAKLNQLAMEKDNYYKDRIHSQEMDIKELRDSKNSLIESHRQELRNLDEKNELKLELAKKAKDEEYKEEINKLEERINVLQRQKAMLNVKQTGEDLETWCNNEVTSYMQNGLFNCKWYKDNDVIREDNEVKGSKADYIFEIYSSLNHNKEDLLANICLDMKDENPDSLNKKSNADYYKQLDKNRIKKGCKYALLVSNLEMNKANDIPIYKVNEYQDMYVVRPAYLMTFLNMIVSLTTRFSKLIQEKSENDIKLKSKIELAKDFEDLKLTYLDKPLNNLKSALEGILKNSESIRKANDSITTSVTNISNTYISNIEDKLARFEIYLNRRLKKSETE